MDASNASEIVAQEAAALRSSQGAARETLALIRELQAEIEEFATQKLKQLHRADRDIIDDWPSRSPRRLTPDQACAYWAEGIAEMLDDALSHDRIKELKRDAEEA